MIIMEENKTMNKEIKKEQQEEMLNPEDLDKVTGGNDIILGGDFFAGKIRVVCQKCQSCYLLEPTWVGRKHKEWRTDCDGIFMRKE